MQWTAPPWQYRRYDRIAPNGSPVFQEGSKIFPTTGASSVNYPQQQLDNGVSKNNRTGYRYKRMVRVMKKLQTRLLDSESITHALPSYAMECLVYNVDDDSFNHTTYLADVRAVLATIFNETRSTGGWNDWEEVNGLKYLFRGSQPWTYQQAHAFASAAWDEIGFD
jgi:hypothetical protein